MDEHETVSYSGEDLEALYSLTRYQKWITRGFAPYLSGEAVEFGAGIGAITQHILPLIDRIDLVEPSDNLVRRLEEQFGTDRRIRIVCETLENYVEKYVGDTRDVAVLVNLLEHLENDCGALQSVAKILKRNGYIVLFVPAMPFLFSKLDAELGHFRRYTKAGLVDVVRRAGLEVKDVRYFDLLGILPWWLVNTVAGKTAFDPRLSKLYDVVGVPITRTIEAIIDPPVGKNLLLVAQRRN